jgi:hypothetical protein
MMESNENYREDICDKCTDRDTPNADISLSSFLHAHSQHYLRIIQLRLHVLLAVMEVLGDFFTYLPDHRVAICKTHRYAVLKSQLNTHLQKNH